MQKRFSYPFVVKELGLYRTLSIVLIIKASVVDIRDVVIFTRPHDVVEYNLVLAQQK